MDVIWGQTRELDDKHFDQEKPRDFLDQNTSNYWVRLAEIE
jgi:hypothetical protein